MSSKSRGGWLRPLVLLAALVFSFAEIARAQDTAASPEKLAVQLTASSNTARRDAAYQLGRLGPPAGVALPVLIKALDDPDKQVWFFSVAAIAALGPEAKEAIPALLDGFDSRKTRGKRDRDKRQVLVRSAYALTRIGEAAIPPLIDALKSDDAALRAGAALALGGMGPVAANAVPGLVANLNHEAPEVRQEASDALGLIGSAAVQPLGDALGATDARTRANAARALGQIGREAQPLASRLADGAEKESDPVARGACLGALTKVGVEPARAVPLLVRALSDENEGVRHASANAIHLLRAADDLLIPALTELVKGQDLAASERAAAVLGRLGSRARPALPAFFELIARRSPPPAPVLEALAQIGPSIVPEVLRAVEKEDPEALTRDHWSVKCLQLTGGEAVPALTTALAGSNISVRLISARALGELGPQASSSTSKLLAAAEDQSPGVRAAALGALASVRAPAALILPALAAGLKDSAPQVRATAVQLVPYLGQNAQPLVSSLLGALDDSESAVRLSAIDAFGALGPVAEPAVAPLLAMLPAVDAAQRARIVAVLGAIGPGAGVALPEITRLLKAGEPSIRPAAVASFAQIEKPDAQLPTLLTALGDGEAGVRRAAAAGLAALRDKALDATAPLIALLQSESDRAFALDALRQIPVRSVPQLIELLGHGDPNVRVFACERLARIGAEAREAKPQLEQLVAQADQPDTVRRGAREALKRIGP